MSTPTFLMLKSSAGSTQGKGNISTALQGAKCEETKPNVMRRATATKTEEVGRVTADRTAMCPADDSSRNDNVI